MTGVGNQGEVIERNRGEEFGVRACHIDFRDSRRLGWLISGKIPNILGGTGVWVPVD